MAISETMRARIRAARDLRRASAHTDELVAKLLDEPNAKRVNSLVGAAAVVGVLWMPLPVMTHAWPTVIGTASVFLG